MFTIVLLAILLTLVLFIQHMIDPTIHFFEDIIMNNPDQTIKNIAWGLMFAETTIIMSIIIWAFTKYIKL